MHSTNPTAHYRNGGRISGPGTGTSDSVPAEVVETGEPLAVSNGERIVSVAQDQYLDGVARGMGHPDVDSMLEEGTGKPVGPTLKYVKERPSKIKQAAKKGRGRRIKHADLGGLIDSAKRAVGMLPPQTMREKYAQKDAELAAKRPAAPAPAPAAPASAPSVKAGVDGAGGASVDNRMKAAGLANGGVVQSAPAEPHAPKNLQESIANQSFDGMSAIATKERLGGVDAVNDTQLAINDVGHKVATPGFGLGGLIDSAKRAVGLLPPQTLSEKYAQKDAELAAKRPAAPAPAPAAPAAPASTPAPSVQAGVDGAGGASVDNRMKAAGLANGGVIQRGVNGDAIMGSPGTVPPAKTARADLESGLARGLANGGKIMRAARGFEAGGIPEPMDMDEVIRNSPGFLGGTKGDEPANLGSDDYYKSKILRENYQKGHPNTANAADETLFIMHNTGSPMFKSLESFKSGEAATLKMAENERATQHGDGAVKSLADGGKIVRAAFEGKAPEPTAGDRLFRPQEAWAQAADQRAAAPAAETARIDALAAKERSAFGARKEAAIAPNVGAPAVSQAYPDESQRAPAVNAKAPTAASAPAGSAAMGPILASAKRTDTGIDDGHGNTVARYDAPGKSPLFTNMHDAAGMVSNEKLLSRGAIKPQDMEAANNMDAKYQSEAQRTNQRAADTAQVAAETAQGQAINRASAIAADAISNRVADERTKWDADLKLSSTLAKKEEKAAAAKALDALNTRQLEAVRNEGAAIREAARDAVLQRDSESRGRQFAADHALAQGTQRLAQNRDTREGAVFADQQKLRGRLDGLMDAYHKAAPADRPALAEQIRVLQGKEQPAHYKMVATQPVKNADGSTSPGMVATLNERTGETQILDPRGKPAATPTPRAEYDRLPRGSSYIGTDGQPYTKG